MGTRDLAYKSVDQFPTSTSAPVSGDFRLFYDKSANQWVKQDASTGDQLFDEVTIDDLTVSTAATFAGATIANLGTVSAATAITTTDLTVPTTATFAGATIADLGTVTTGALAAGTIGSATVAEVSRIADLSARIVILTGTTAITESAHEGRVIYLTGTSSQTFTMLEPTGSGGRYKFVVGAVNANPTIITFTDQVNTNFIGSLNMLDADGSVAVSAVNGDHNITLDGDAATGGALGDTIELVDVATDVWAVQGTLFVVAGQAAATPFNAS